MRWKNSEKQLQTTWVEFSRVNERCRGKEWTNVWEDDINRKEVSTDTIRSQWEGNSGGEI